MQVLRVDIEAPVASFRYPHFLIGRQLTFEMPPPSTVYGLTMAALGRLLEPASLEFAYAFHVGGRGSDLEHQHILTRKVQKRSVKHELTVQPHHRDFLYDVRLELYLRSPDVEELERAFRGPTYCMTIGRSQDLASIRGVRLIDLEEKSAGYFESTILPYGKMRTRTGRGVTVHMPKYIGPPPERQPALYERYVLLRERIYAGRHEEFESLSPVDRLIGLNNSTSETWWVDPSTPERRGARRVVEFQGFN